MLRPNNKVDEPGTLFELSGNVFVPNLTLSLLGCTELSVCLAKAFLRPLTLLLAVSIVLVDDVTFDVSPLVDVVVAAAGVFKYELLWMNTPSQRILDTRHLCFYLPIRLIESNNNISVNLKWEKSLSKNLDIPYLINLRVFGRTFEDLRDHEISSGVAPSVEIVLSKTFFVITLMNMKMKDFLQTAKITIVTFYLKACATIGYENSTKNDNLERNIINY
uniref:Uncharacterized protein n=1 Tax=Glossina palpalis gambiensis TaxID=67801 RepID=A0A1B0AVH8_9MUSC